MVKFKVVQASRLLLFFAIGMLVLVIGLLVLKMALDQPEPALNTSANLVNADTAEEAKTASVFASSGNDITIEVLDAPKISTTTPQFGPNVLIYHTHTHEAYEQVSDDPYPALEAWRTADNDHSVVRVGAELARQLESLGFEVVHDKTDHEGDDLPNAYTRSLATLESYEHLFDLYIDLHRDAWTEADAEGFVGPDGKPMAQLMLLIGNGNGFDTKPYYPQNLAFAEALTKRVNAIVPGICKPVLVKDGRYNQHIGVFSILVEVGHNRNTLREALATVEPLSKALYSLLIDSPQPELQQMRKDYAQSSGLKHTN